MKLKGKKISEVPQKSELNGEELIPFALNNDNGSVTVDTIAKYAYDKEGGDFTSRLAYDVLVPGIEFIADRAEKDALGNIITDIYVTRSTAKNAMTDALKEQLPDAVKNIKEGFVTPDMLSEETKQLFGAKDIVNYPDNEDITVNSSELLTFADKSYNPIIYSGMGRKRLRKHIINGVNTLTQNMFSDENTCYIIQYDYELEGSTIIIPKGCVLDFNGGSIKNGIIVGNNSIIFSTPYEIFKNVELDGTWSTYSAYSEWFGAKSDGTTDDSTAIQKCIDSFGMCNLLAKNYYIWNHIVIRFKNQLVGENKGSTIINANNDDEAIRFTHHGCCERFTINIINESLKCGIRYLLTESNAYQSVIRDIEIKYPTWCAEGTMGLSLESRYGIGVYMLTAENIDVRMADVAFNFHSEKETESTPICWINTNYIKTCRAHGCNTAVKMTCVDVCDINGNDIDVTFQNATHLHNLKPVYDIGSNLRIYDNRIKGFVWDLDPNMQYGSVLGNMQNNIQVSDISNYLHSSSLDKYKLIGTFPTRSSGYATVTLNFNRFTGQSTDVKLVLQGSTTKTVACVFYNRHHSDGGNYSFGYIEKDGVYYIYVKGLAVGYTNVSIKDSSFFTYTTIEHPLTNEDVISKIIPITMPNKKYYVQSLSNANPSTNLPPGTININPTTNKPSIHLPEYGYKELMIQRPSLTYPIMAEKTELVTSLDELISGDYRGIYYRYGYSDALGITKPEYSYRCLLMIYNNGNTINTNNPGSFVIAFSAVNGISFIVKKYKIETDGSWNNKWDILWADSASFWYLNNALWTRKFNTDDKRPVWNNGEKFVTADGVLEGTLRSGAKSARPTVVTNFIYVGFEYFDTTLEKPIWHKGEDIWVDSSGAIV